MRSWRRVLPVLLLALGACRTAPEPLPDAVLVVRVTPPAPPPAGQAAQPASPQPALGLGMLVYIDDRPQTWPVRQPDLRVPVSSGSHRVEVRLPGYFTAYREVAVPHGGQGLVQVVLRQDPDAAGLSVPEIGGSPP